MFEARRCNVGRVQVRIEIVNSPLWAVCFECVRTKRNFVLLWAVFFEHFCAEREPSANWVDEFTALGGVSNSMTREHVDA